jgi:inositol transport system permease protein
MVAASCAQSSDWAKAIYLALTDMPAIVPVLIGVTVGVLAGLINGLLVAYVQIPPFIATLGLMVSARGLARLYTKGQPISGATDQFIFLGSGRCRSSPSWRSRCCFTSCCGTTAQPVLQVHLCDRRQRSGGEGYGHRRREAPREGILDCRLLVGVAGVVTAARAQTAQSSMGVNYELDATAATVIGGVSLVDGVGRISGAVVTTLILGAS